jgi:hypothetical protein
MKQILLAGVLLIALLTGCTHGNDNNTGIQPSVVTQEDTLAIQSPDSATPTKEKAPEDTPTSESFEKGVFVDFSKLNEDFITDDILQKLQDSLEALVNKDEVKFKAGLLDGHDTPGNMDFVKNTNQYKFLDISESKYNKIAKSIMISLSVQILRDKKIYDGSLTFYFETDKTGEWKIQLVD